DQAHGILQVSAYQRKPAEVARDDQITVHRTKAPHFSQAFRHFGKASPWRSTAILAQQISWQGAVILEVVRYVERTVAPPTVIAQRMIKVKAVGGAPREVGAIDTGRAHKIGDEGCRPG